jgi:hypothetical protein
MVKNNHRNQNIRNWKKRGLLCREGETYDSIYDKVMETEECQLCNNKFTATDNGKYQRCMDHCHIDGYFRKVLCRGCNANYKISQPKTKNHTKSGFSWISLHKTKNKSGNYSIGWQYQRKIGEHKRTKRLKSLTRALALSFIYLLKEPIS